MTDCAMRVVTFLVRFSGGTSPPMALIEKAWK